jgi:hypothetical protein
MKTDILAIAAALSDGDLLSRLSCLAVRSREDTVEMVAHLAELQARRIYLAEGYGSAFVYCRAALCLSEHAAYSRLLAARVARQFPVVLEGLADGSLNLTTVRLLAPHLTPDNHRDVLAQAAGRSKREIETLVARLAPQLDVKPLVRKLPAMDTGASTGGSGEALSLTRPTQPMHSTEDGSGAAPGPARTAPAIPLGAPQARPVVAPLSPTRYRLQCTIGEEAHRNLRLAQDLLRREVPDGDPGAIVERALALLLAHVAKEKTAATTTPGPARPTAAGSRHIPAAVKRAVWLRDRGQCAFVARIGRRCTERAFLEFHHVQPFAIGGETTAGNISLRCRRHNVHEAEMVFGRLAHRPPAVATGQDGRQDRA